MLTTNNYRCSTYDTKYSVVAMTYIYIYIFSVALYLNCIGLAIVVFLTFGGLFPGSLRLPVNVLRLVVEELKEQISVAQLSEASFKLTRK